MILSQIAFALGACGGLAMILMPSAVNTASKELVNWPAQRIAGARATPGLSATCAQSTSRAAAKVAPPRS